jgi:hypothetical protein
MMIIIILSPQERVRLKTLDCPSAGKKQRHSCAFWSLSAILHFRDKNVSQVRNEGCYSFPGRSGSITRICGKSNFYARHYEDSHPPSSGCSRHIARVLRICPHVPAYKDLRSMSCNSNTCFVGGDFRIQSDLYF